MDTKWLERDKKHGNPRDKKTKLGHQTVEIPADTEGTTIPLLLKFTPGGKVDEIGERPPEESYTIPHPSYDQPDSIKNVKSSLEILPIRYQRH